MELTIHDQEILLQNLWKSRKLFAQQLRTTTGKSVEVIFAGTENLDSGPDFKDAVIKLDGKLLKGGVEVEMIIHEVLSENFWYPNHDLQTSQFIRYICHFKSNLAAATDAPLSGAWR